MKKRTGTWLMACLLALLAGGLPRTKAERLRHTPPRPGLYPGGAMSIIAESIGRDRNGKKTSRIKHPFWSKDGRFVYVGD